ncbi:MAG TPA: ribosome-binding factor A [Polyangiaceae bacterium]|nr:ribosome-binding factor A [Polyangiaceae bacterium]
MGNRRNRRSRHGGDPGAGIRALRLEQLFCEELNSILDGEIGDARLDGVCFTLVELARDGSRARIWYSMKTKSSPDAVRIARSELALEQAARFLRWRLCESLPLKRMPELRFRFDPAALGAVTRARAEMDD